MRGLVLGFAWPIAFASLTTILRQGNLIFYCGINFDPFSQKDRPRNTNLFKIQILAIFPATRELLDGDPGLHWENLEFFIKKNQ